MRPEPVNLPTSGIGGTRKSPTERTLAYLKKQGFVSGIVERRNPWIKYKTHDLFGIIDIVSLTPAGVLGVQSTGTDFAGHLNKLTVTHADRSAQWLLTPGTGLLLIGWRKVKGDTGVMHYEPRTRYVKLEDLVAGLKTMGRDDLVDKIIERLR